MASNPQLLLSPTSTGAEAEEDDSEVERLLQQVADARHAGDRRDAMSQLSSLLPDNPRVGNLPLTPQQHRSQQHSHPWHANTSPPLQRSTMQLNARQGLCRCPSLDSSACNCLQAQYAISSMGLPVLLSVISEDRDDLELLKGALEVLQLSVALPDGMQQQEQAEVSWTPKTRALNGQHLQPSHGQCVTACESSAA